MNRTMLALFTGSALALGGGAVLAQSQADHSAHSAHAEHTPQVHAIHAAVAAPDRPAEARALDEGRKPAEVLAFLGLKPGMAAADLIPGEGYWSEIMAHVVAPSGSVAALQPQQFRGGEAADAAWNALSERAPGVSLVHYPFEAFTYQASSFDFAIMSLNYHDLYWVSEQYSVPFTDPDTFVAALYTSMKLGGIVGIIDHTGAPGDTREGVDKTHRIDPAVVRADFERAGFVLADQSDLLANPDDDLSVSVFAPGIRGNTDRFVMKFVKPAAD
ncbi:class I SAM-dependent methyltransferase [Qipengyuania sp. ASV99]|uniref:class I SAM-dependent methyltransferase n=1 Tax=Qipengyuania sp. ASV99 TaxID=3399681 RepID=UPI003A4C7D72